MSLEEGLVDSSSSSSSSAAAHNQLESYLNFTSASFDSASDADRQYDVPPPAGGPPPPPPIVVINDDRTSMASLRRRRAAPATATSASAAPAQANFIVVSVCARWKSWRDRWELFHHDVSSWLEPRLNWLNNNQRRVRNMACGAVIVVVALAVVVMALFSSRDAFIVDVTRPSYARHGFNGVNLNAPSRDVTCAELSSGRTRTPPVVAVSTLRDNVRYLLDKDRHECVCAPMLGTPLRYMAVRVGDAVADVFNPSVDDSWHDTDSSGQRIVPDVRMRVLEHQRMLFPSQSEAVRVVRRFAIRLTYRDEACRSASMIVRNATAFNVQACIDLMAGRSVYDVGSAVGGGVE